MNMDVKPLKTRAKLMRENKEDRMLAYYEKHMEAGSDSARIIQELMKRYGYSSHVSIYRILKVAAKRRAENGNK